jgi:ATP-dependent RNA helicase DDX10/DBP4
LKKVDYEKPTEIQRESIGIALRGYDLLGAAKTGSGKTLAFIVPVSHSIFQIFIQLLLIYFFKDFRMSLST